MLRFTNTAVTMQAGLGVRGTQREYASPDRFVWLAAAVPHLGALGVTVLGAWNASARFALATMFVFTAMAHFAPMRKDLIAMVPPGLPRPDLLVFSTGLMELAGGVGLLFEATRWWAALGLMSLLFAMFPANVSASRRGIPLRGRRATPLCIGIPMQVPFVVWAWLVR